MSTEKIELPVHRVTNGPMHHFFGYYDTHPWAATGRYVLAMEVDFIDRPPTADDAAGIGMIDMETGEWKQLAETRAWCWQQSTMLQWLETAPDRLIIFNDCRENQFVSVILDVHSGEERVLPRPVYAASRDGRQAVSLNFARVDRLRPGYGYKGVLDPGVNHDHPDDDGIWWIDLDTGDNRLIISLQQIVEFEHNETMPGTQHRFNHLQFNTDDSRFLMLHRWRPTPRNPDGSDLCLVSDHDMISHIDWKDESHILAWATRFDRGNYFYLFGDHGGDIEIVGKDVMTADGHCSYSPDRQWILNDTYPDAEESKRALYLYRPEENLRADIGRFYSPPEITGEFRCDLHPRWNRDGTQICFDSVHEGDRQMYRINVSEIVG